VNHEVHEGHEPLEKLIFVTFVTPTRWGLFSLRKV